MTSAAALRLYVSWLMLPSMCFFGGLSAAAQQAVQAVPSCKIYDPRPSCSEATRNALRRSFGLPTLAQIGQDADGGANREAIVGIVEMKGGGALALVFRGASDGTASVEIRRAQPFGKTFGYPPMTATISKTSWRALIAKGKMLGDVFARDEIYVCGARFTIEFVDHKGNVRAPVGDSCGNEPRGQYFASLAEAAIAQLPHCNVLAPQSGGDITRKILECFYLQGDRMAAAELYNAIENRTDGNSFWNMIRWDDASDVKALLADKPVLHWPGLPILYQPDAIAEFLTGAWLFPFEFEYGAIVAETPDRITVQGCIGFTYDDNFQINDALAGPFSAVWERFPGGAFRLHYFGVAPAHPSPERRAQWVNDSKAPAFTCPALHLRSSSMDE